MKSRFIVFPAPGQVAIGEEEIGAPARGEVLCRASASLVSLGTEGHCFQGVYDPGTYWEEFIKFPFRPGYSMVARVERVGEGVTRYRPGDRVTGMAPHAERFAASEDHLFPVPDAVEDAEAVWATLARTTQLGVRRAALELGESVAVVGLGILGQLTVQYLALSGARHVIAIDPSALRLELARAGGATHVVRTPVEGAEGEVSRITEGQMADAVFEITGRPETLAPASRLVRKLGRVVLLGDTPTPSRQPLGPRIVGDSLAILGVHGLLYPEVATPFNRWTAAAMTTLFFDYLRSGRMRVKPLVTHRLSPMEANQVYTTIARQTESALGIVFDWSRLH